SIDFEFGSQSWVNKVARRPSLGKAGSDVLCAETSFGYRHLLEAKSRAPRPCFRILEPKEPPLQPKHVARHDNPQPREHDTGHDARYDGNPYQPRFGRRTLGCTGYDVSLLALRAHSQRKHGKQHDPPDQKIKGEAESQAHERSSVRLARVQL